MRSATRPSALPARDLAREVAGTSFLTELGERVRDWRARRGMTRKLLARDSGVSERYLAQLETGQGNISVLLLQQIAFALNVPLAELLSGAPAQGELARTVALLRRLPERDLARLRARLAREPNGHARRERIALIGLRGAGKSTLGARAAKALGIPFIELDRQIESEAGTSLSEIFLLYGQAGYRRYERRALEQVIERNERALIATGGSIVSEPATYDLLLESCRTVWLKATPEEHMARVLAQGDTRPMAGNKEAMEDLRRILHGRAALYGQADRTIDTSGKSTDRALAELLSAIADD